MAVNKEHAPIREFSDWYVGYDPEGRDGCLEFKNLSDCAASMWRMYDDYKREMDGRCHNMEKLEAMADGEVVSPKPDLPNVSSGETAGIIRRMARNLVQHVPNLEVVSRYDDDSMHGIIAKHVLLTKIVGSDSYSSDMQQNLFASTKTALSLGFDCVVPCLLQLADGTWITRYDTIHYRDVFPEPGAKDVRLANDVFVRRYLTRGDIKQLIRDQVSGWDHAALRRLLKSRPVAPPREEQSNSYADKKRRMHASGYEIITYYSNSGESFLTFAGGEKLLLRIEKNKHPLHWHPVFFLVLEKDNTQPLGKSQVELIYGRQEFQDLMLNGAMKMYYRNINPPLFGYGAVNAGLSQEAFGDDGVVKVDFEELAVNYYVRTVPGSLVELEDEKQLRILNSLFVPLSQAMPALGAMQDPAPIQRAAQAMQYIIEKQIELSGSNRSGDLKSIMQSGRTEQFNEYEQRASAFEQNIGGTLVETSAFQEQAVEAIVSLQEQMKLQAEAMAAMMKHLGMSTEPSAVEENNPEQSEVRPIESAASISIARA